MTAYLGVLDPLLKRRVQPRRHVVVERINEADAARSDYLPALKQRFGVSLDHRRAVLFPRTTP